MFLPLRGELSIGEAVKVDVDNERIGATYNKRHDAFGIRSKNSCRWDVESSRYIRLSAKRRESALPEASRLCLTLLRGDSDVTPRSW
jgi:hypothetical protein